MDNSAHGQEDIRMPLTSVDVTVERVETLKELFPEASTKTKGNFEWPSQALKE
jgi:hypothetical protein